MNGLIDKRLVDEAMDAYVSWREACVRVEEAYASWVSAAGTRAAAAFRTHAAALDHEERAADVYNRFIQRVADSATTDHGRGAALDAPAVGGR
jgi:hypothetical protein